jgi:hypothetical protein
MIIEKLLTPEVIITIISTFGALITGFFAYLMKTHSANNQSNFKSTIDTITSEILLIKTDIGALLNANCVATSRYNFLKDANEIIADAIKYSSSQKLNNYLIYKGDELKYAIVNLVLTNPNINDLDIEYIRGVINELSARLTRRSTELLGIEYSTKMISASELMVRKLEMDINSLINDSVFNNKRIRFFALMSSFLRDSLSLNIREYNYHTT